MVTHDKIVELHNARIEAEQAKAERIALMESFQSTPEWQETYRREKVAAEYVENLENLLKGLAIETSELESPNNKHPFPGVTVKDVTSFVYDPKQALNWCKSNLPTALKLDAKPFEAVVKVGGIIPEDIAHIEIVKRADIAADLSKYIPADPE